MPILETVSCLQAWDTELLYVCMNVSPDWTGLHEEMVMALRHLCVESVNRAKIRHAGGLALMLRIVRNSSTACLRSFILNGLVQFFYDEESLKVRKLCFISCAASI
jgi:hypothetical protein